MITIAICDDMKAVVNSLYASIEHYSKEESRDIQIRKFHSGINLLDKYTGQYDIVFLDIRMPDMDGLEVARRLRKRDEKVSIVFLTSLIQHALDGYQVGASNYIIKPISYKRLKMELDRWFDKNILRQAPYLLVRNENGSHKVMLKDLLYIETYNRNALIHTKDGEQISHKKLRVLEAELQEEGFARIHTSYIVNLAYIKDVDKTDVILLNGEVIPVSKAKRREFMKSLAHYWGEQL